MLEQKNVEEVKSTIHNEDEIFNELLRKSYESLNKIVIESDTAEKDKASMHLNLCIATAAISLITLTDNASNSLPTFMRGLKEFVTQFESAKELKSKKDSDQ